MCRQSICSIFSVCNRSVSSNGCIVSNVSSGVSDISIVSNVSNVGNFSIVRSVSSISNVSIVCNSKIKINKNKKMCQVDAKLY